MCFVAFSLIFVARHKLIGKISLIVSFSHYGLIEIFQNPLCFLHDANRSWFWAFRTKVENHSSLPLAGNRGSQTSSDGVQLAYSTAITALLLRDRIGSLAIWVHRPHSFYPLSEGRHRSEFFSAMNRFLILSIWDVQHSSSRLTTDHSVLSDTVQEVRADWYFINPVNHIADSFAISSSESLGVQWGSTRLEVKRASVLRHHSD